MTATTPTTDQGQTTIIARIPTWATSVKLEEDGYVLFRRAVRETTEVVQFSHLVVDEKAGTVSYQVDGDQGLHLWLGGIDNSIRADEAREILRDLQELLAVVDEIEAAL